MMTISVLNKCGFGILLIFFLFAAVEVIHHQMYRQRQYSVLFAWRSKLISIWWLTHSKSIISYIRDIQRPKKLRIPNDFAWFAFPNWQIGSAFIGSNLWITKGNLSKEPISIQRWLSMEFVVCFVIGIEPESRIVQLRYFECASYYFMTALYKSRKQSISARCRGNPIALN